MKKATSCTSTENIDAAVKKKIGGEPPEHRRGAPRRGKSSLRPVSFAAASRW